MEISRFEGLSYNLYFVKKYLSSFIFVQKSYLKVHPNYKGNVGILRDMLQTS